jgi:hypothetical protein
MDLAAHPPSAYDSNDCSVLFPRSNVLSTARPAIHLQFDVSAKSVELRAVYSPKWIVLCVVDCTGDVDENIDPQGNPWNFVSCSREHKKNK